LIVSVIACIPTSWEGRPLLTDDTLRYRRRWRPPIAGGLPACQRRQATAVRQPVTAPAMPLNLTRQPENPAAQGRPEREHRPEGFSLASALRESIVILREIRRRGT
jgi:hypothetical protein